MEGSEFGRYQLLELLGRGGMGEVWRARDSMTNRTVALKVLLPQYADDETFQKRFLREAQMAAALNEPHIVPIHNYGEIDGRLFVDMRLIEGQDLHALLDAGPLPPPRAVHIIEQVAMALDSAHDVGLVHRDVKPSNVLVAKHDFTYLIDFGIARVTGDIGLTATGSTVGTWHYMAPERFNTGEADSRSDTYALACVLYECLTGARPFPGDSMQQQVTGHLLQPPPRPSATIRGLPQTLDGVVVKGMAKNPGDRYPSTMDLARAARTAVEGSGPVVVTPRESETRPVPRQFATPPPAAYPSSPPAPYPTPPPAASAPPSMSFPPQPQSAPLYARSAPPVPPNTPAPFAAAATPAAPKNRKPLLIGGAVAAIVAIIATTIGIVVSSSSSDEGSTAQTTRTTSERTTSDRTTTSRSTRTSTTSSPAPATDGSNPTIASYIADNDITETAIKPGDAGAPTVTLPLPPGWEQAGADKPEWAYDAILYKGPDAGTYTPSIVALMSKLTGDVDQQAILDVAPGELYNLEGFELAPGSETESTLAGFPAYQLGGTWVQDGTRKLVAQKTVVIPASDGLFVLQMNADGMEDQRDILDSATAVIDTDTKITPP